MRKIIALTLFILGPVLPAAAFTPVTTPNAYMVENTSGTDTSGNFCYDFQTKPTCSARITNLTATISSGSLPSGSTQYIQNSATPTTATQVFNVSSGTATTFFCTTCTVRTALILNGSAGTSGQVAQSQGPGVSPQWATLSASAGGSPTQIQYNLGGVLAGLPSVVTVGSVTISTPTAILGTQTNNSAVAGYVGEYIEALYSGITSTSGQFVDGNSILLTAGDWDVSHLSVCNPSSTITTMNIGISVTAGNSSTGLVAGNNQLIFSYAGTGNTALAIPTYRQSFAVSTIVYAKISTTNGGGATCSGRLSARRVR